eukprot:03025.XXX_92359_93749_1 [CDS] Oithona nana genome sequencing.
MIHDRDKAKKTKMKIQEDAKNEYNRVRRRSSVAKRAILKVSKSNSLPAKTESKVFKTEEETTTRNPNDAISLTNEVETPSPLTIDRPLNLNGIVLKEEEEDMKMVRSKSVQVREEIEAVEQKKAKLAFHRQTSLSPCRSERKMSSKV